MRVQRGPDWQWSDQDGGMGHQGTVLMVKEWKSTPRAAVRIKWDDNGTDNTYRYGGENCYDVVLLIFASFLHIVVQIQYLIRIIVLFKVWSILHAVLCMKWFLSSFMVSLLQCLSRKRIGEVT